MRLIKYGDDWAGRGNIGDNYPLRPSCESPWTEGVIAGFDIETTGTDIESDRMVSAAIVIDIPGRPRGPEVCQWLINPGIDIPLPATAVHGISTEEAQQKGSLPEIALRGIVETLTTIRHDHGPVPIVVFNSVFDWTILDRELDRHRGEALNIPLPVIDPLISDRALNTYRSGRRTLSAVSANYGVTIKGSHTAAGDVLTSIKLARAMGAKYPQYGTADLESMQAFQRGACRDWADHFTEYRRRDDPDFTCPGTWPYHPRGEYLRAPSNPGCGWCACKGCPGCSLSNNDCCTCRSAGSPEWPPAAGLRGLAD